MIVVRLKDDETVGKLVKRFKKKVENSNLLKECKSRKFYIKKNVLRKIEENKSLARQHYRNRED